MLYVLWAMFYAQCVICAICGGLWAWAIWVPTNNLLQLCGFQYISVAIVNRVCRHYPSLHLQDCVKEVEVALQKLNTEAFSQFPTLGNVILSQLIAFVNECADKLVDRVGELLAYEVCLILSWPSMSFRLMGNGIWLVAYRLLLVVTHWKIVDRCSLILSNGEWPMANG